MSLLHPKLDISMIFPVIFKIAFNMSNQNHYSHFPDDKTEPTGDFVCVCVCMLVSQWSGEWIGLWITTVSDNVASGL